MTKFRSTFIFAITISLISFIFQQYRIGFKDELTKTTMLLKCSTNSEVDLESREKYYKECREVWHVTNDNKAINP